MPALIKASLRNQIGLFLFVVRKFSVTPVTLDTRNPGDAHLSIVSLCFLRVVVTVGPFTRALRFDSWLGDRRRLPLCSLYGLASGSASDCCDCGVGDCKTRHGLTKK